MLSKPAPYLKALTHLRVYEEIMLYGNLLIVSEKEEEQAGNFLQSEYEDEQLSYPYQAPELEMQHYGCPYNLYCCPITALPRKQKSGSSRFVSRY